MTDAVAPALARVHRRTQSALAVRVDVLDGVEVGELPRCSRVALVLPPEGSKPCFLSIGFTCMNSIADEFGETEI